MASDTVTTLRDAGPQRARHDDEASRSARWRQSWVLALRLARRDVLRHRGRSLLIVVLVAAPVLLIAGLATAISTDEVSAQESLQARLGGAQAEIGPAANGPIEQLPSGTSYNETGQAYRPFGTRSAGDPWTAEQLSTLTGGRIVPVDFPTLVRAADNRVTRLSALAVDEADLPGSGLAQLVAGRWPAAADEVLVTERGAGRGLPAEGPVSLRLDGGRTERALRVVGTAEARDQQYRSFDLVTVDRSTAEPGSGTWLLFRDRPVSWAEVTDWNAYGLLVTSRAVVDDPPPIWQQPSDLVQQEAATTGEYAAFFALIVVGLLIETSLLAGPAFAVSAVRRRRSLAQVACNGAEAAQLNRTVLAEALLLGGCAALLGAALGAFGGWAALTVRNRLDSYASSGPLDIPWLALTVLVAAATVAAVVAALVPARGVSRIAIADVLAGRERSRPVNPGTPAVGLTLVLIAVAALVLTSALGRPGDTPWLQAVAAGALVIGVLLLVPTVLVRLGRTAPRLPLTLRLPLRDATRQRGRSASAVAAVVATVATLTILSIANASDDAHARAAYVTDRAAGHGYVTQQRTDSPIAVTVEEIRRQHPDWVVSRHDQLGRFGAAGVDREPQVVAVVPPGCTAEEALGIGELSDAVYERCASLGTDVPGGTVQTVDRGSAARSSAPAPIRAALDRGAVLLSDETAVTGDTVRLAVGEVSGSPGDRVERVLRAEALVVSAADLYAAAGVSPPAPTRGPSSYETSTLGPLAGLLTAETAAALDLPTSFGYLEVIDPSGPISARDEAALNDRILALITVERGYQSTLGPLLAGLLGVAGMLVLVAALVATALAQAESRADLATLAALGGSAGLRRRLAAGEALVVAGLGSVLGLATGLLPGAAFGLAFTVEGQADPATGELAGAGDGLVVVPWSPLLVVLVGIPLLAALLAAGTVRRTPPLTRRLT